jgi:ZIP family zinc transporter
VRGAPSWVGAGPLALTGGALTSVVVEEIVPEAHRETDARLAALLLVGGLGLFAALSVLLGGE